MSLLTIHDSKVYVDGIEADPLTDIPMTAGTLATIVHEVIEQARIGRPSPEEAARMEAAGHIVPASWHEEPEAVEAKAAGTPVEWRPTGPIDVRVVSTPTRTHDLFRDSEGRLTGSVEYDS